MRISKTISITLPPDMLKMAMKLAKEENRTMSEFIRETIRQYEFRIAMRQAQNSPSAKRSRMRVTEEEIVDVVKSVRKKLWPEYRKKHGLGKNPKKKK